jgi:hypothetical protein
MYNSYWCLNTDGGVERKVGVINCPQKLLVMLYTKVNVLRYYDKRRVTHI